MACKHEPRSPAMFSSCFFSLTGAQGPSQSRLDLNLSTLYNRYCSLTGLPKPEAIHTSICLHTPFPMLGMPFPSSGRIFFFFFVAITTVYFHIPQILSFHIIPNLSKKKKKKVLVTQLCLSLCDTMDCSPPGSSVHGIPEARILEWVPIPFSRGSFHQKEPIPNINSVSVEH